MMTGLLACLFSFQSAVAADIPTGTLNVDRTLVRVGSRSQLDWQIQYPAGVTEVIEMVTPGIIKTKKDLQMRVRVLGASFQQAKNNNGHGNNYDGVDSGAGSGGKNGEIDPSGSFDDEIKSTKFTELPVELMWSINNSSWTRIFYGTQSQVNPTTLVLDTTVKKGDIVDFGGRGYWDKAWLPFYNTAATSPNVVTLKNGDTIPSTIPALQLGLIEDFLKPYLAADEKTVSIGDKDLILLMELGQTSPDSSGFDLQDLVVLVTFE
jgi:hypothetical protein